MGAAKIFRIGSSQMVRMPNECRLEGEKEVLACKIGDVVVLYPKLDPWKVMWQSLEMFGDDFMTQRIQPETQEREFL